MDAPKILFVFFPNIFMNNKSAISFYAACHYLLKKIRSVRWTITKGMITHANSQFCVFTLTPKFCIKAKYDAPHRDHKCSRAPINRQQNLLNGLSHENVQITVTCIRCFQRSQCYDDLYIYSFVLLQDSQINSKAFFF